MQIKTIPTFNLLGQATRRSATQECKIYANVHYKVIYAEMGFNENKQKYIVEIQKSSHEVDWTFNRKVVTEKQDFGVYVTF